jgi:hypothetical protein
MMNKRADWAWAFSEIGYSRRMMNRMSEAEFRNVCQFLIEAGLATAKCPSPVISGTSSLAGKTSDHSLIEEQDAEYLRVLNEAREQEKRAMAKKLHDEAVRAQKHEEEKANAKNARESIRERASQIPPEPTNGIPIAFRLPNGKRIARRFAAEDRADDLFAFVADLDDMFDARGRSFRFEFCWCGLGSAHLNREKTLAEHGIKGRVLFYVSIDDD